MVKAFNSQVRRSSVWFIVAPIHVPCSVDLGTYIRCTPTDCILFIYVLNKVSNFRTTLFSNYNNLRVFADGIKIMGACQIEIIFIKSYLYNKYFSNLEMLLMVFKD